MKIIVLTKYATGNNEVGEICTVARVFPSNSTLQYVYDEMVKEGNWDIIIPRAQKDKD